MKTLRLAGSVAAVLILYGAVSDTPHPAPPDVQAEAPVVQPVSIPTAECTCTDCDCRPCVCVAPVAPVAAPKAKAVKSTGHWETRRYGFRGRFRRRVWVRHNSSAATNARPAPVRRTFSGG